MLHGLCTNFETGSKIFESEPRGLSSSLRFRVGGRTIRGLRFRSGFSVQNADGGQGLGFVAG